MGPAMAPQQLQLPRCLPMSQRLLQSQASPAMAPQQLQLPQCLPMSQRLLHSQQLELPRWLPMSERLLRSQASPAMASPAVPPRWVAASQALAWPVRAFRAMACLAVSQGGALASPAPDPLVTASPATDCQAVMVLPLWAE